MWPSDGFGAADRVRLFKVFHRVRFGVAAAVAAAGIILGLAWQWPGAMVITPLAFLAILDASLRQSAEAPSAWVSFVLDPLLVYIGMSLVGVPGEAIVMAFCQGAAATLLLLPIRSGVVLVAYSAAGLWVALAGLLPQIAPLAPRHADALGIVAGVLFASGLVAEILMISAEMGRLAGERQAAVGASRRLARSKDDLIVAVSHEIRTPLTSVMGLAEELAARAGEFDATEVSEIAALIASESAEMAHLVEDLLVVSRGDDVALSSEIVDLRSEAETAAAVAARARHATPPPVSGIGGALADRTRVRQVVRNLVSNAIDHGGDRVWLEVGVSGLVAYVAVCDDGPGIAPDQVERAFVPFERVGGAPTQPASIGVGLSVARGLARAMGGELTYTRDGGVTTFLLRLPVAVGARQRIAS